MMRRLFLDDRNIREKNNLILRFHQADKFEGNPVFVPDLPWERSLGHSSGTVLYEEGRFRFWYQVYTMPEGPAGTFHIAYAESNDGIEWRKPELGLVEYAGSTKNNLLLLNAGWGNLFIDQHDPDPSRRYKMMYLGAVKKKKPGVLKGWMGMPGYWGWCAAYSPDGFHWEVEPENPVFTFCKDGGIVFGWDESIDRYTAYLMPLERYTLSHMEDPVTFESLADEPMRQHPRIRLNGYTTSSDFIHWEPVKTVLYPDANDPPAMEFYPMAVSLYQDWYISLIYSLYCTTAEDLPRKQGLMDVQIAVSRDGVEWKRLGGHQPFIPRGPRGSFDAGMVGPNLGLNEKDGKLWLYYNAWTGEHKETKAYRRAQDPGLWEMGRLASAVGLAFLRQDGFMSLEAGEDEGSFTTTPEDLEGKDLIINGETFCDGGYIGVEVVRKGESVSTVPGFTMSDSDSFRGDSVRHVMTWKGEGLSRINLTGCSLGFTMRNAGLYSYSLVDPVG